MKGADAVGYRPEIDGLRCLAVVPVVLFHANVQLFRGGFVGVDIFFVISGYLITSIISREVEAGVFSFKTFYRRRAWRILPALGVVALASAPLAWLLMLPDDYQQFSMSILSVLTFSSNFMFWKQSSYFEASDVKPLIHTWSLGVEEQFYILFPIILVLVWRTGRRGVLFAIVTTIVISFGLSEYASRVHPNFNFYLPVTRAWELGAGALCYFFPGTRNTRWAQVLSALGLSLILASIFLVDGSTRFPSIFAVPVVGGAALTLAFATPTTVVGRLLSMKPMTGIGLISYSAYLWHQPVMAFWRLYAETGQDTPHYILLTTAIFALAFFTWKYVETPCRRIAAFRTPQREMRLVMAGLAMVLISLGGLGAYLVPSYAAMVNPARFKRPPALTSEIFCPGFKALSNDAWCERIGTGPFRLVIWGDSHAGMLAPVVAPDPAMSVFIISVPGCPPLMEVRRTDGIGTAPNCSYPSQIRSYADYVKSIEPNVVVLAARWTLYLYGWRRLGVQQLETHLLSRDKFRGSSVKESRRAFVSGLRATVSFLAAGTRIFVLEQVPDLQHVPQFRRAILDETPVAPIARWHTTEQQIMSDAAAGLPLEFIDPKTLFCAAESCRLVADGLQIYADDNHLSEVGAMRLWELILQRVCQSCADCGLHRSLACPR